MVTNDQLAVRLANIEQKLDAVEKRLDRWDGAITLVKAAASFVGFGGLVAILAALVTMSR